MNWGKTVFTQTISALGFWGPVSTPHFLSPPYHTRRDDLSKIWYCFHGSPKWKWSCTPYNAQWPCAPCVGVGSDQAARCCSPDQYRVRAFEDRFLPWPAIRLYTATSLEASRGGVSGSFLPCHYMWNGHREAPWAPSFSKRALVCHPQPLSFPLFNSSLAQPGLELKWKEIPMSCLPL